jgi:hypothetical protein
MKEYILYCAVYFDIYTNHEAVQLYVQFSIYRKVAISRPVECFGQRSQYIRFPLHRYYESA